MKKGLHCLSSQLQNDVQSFKVLGLLCTWCFYTITAFSVLGRYSKSNLKTLLHVLLDTHILVKRDYSNDLLCGFIFCCQLDSNILNYHSFILIMYLLYVGALLCCSFRRFDSLLPFTSVQCYIFSKPELHIPLLTVSIQYICDGWHVNDHQNQNP